MAVTIARKEILDIVLKERDHQHDHHPDCHPQNLQSDLERPRRAFVGVRVGNGVGVARVQLRHHVDQGDVKENAGRGAKDPS